MGAATLVALGHAMALPLMPEFIAPRDGAEKQDCERVAAKRWLATHGERMKALRPIYLGDDLFACQPIVEAIKAVGGDVLLTANPAEASQACFASPGPKPPPPSSHIALYDLMQGAPLEEYKVAIHTVCDSLEDLWTRTAKRARKRFFEHIRTITAYLVFPDWHTLMQTLIASKPPPEIAVQIAI